MRFLRTGGRNVVEYDRNYIMDEDQSERGSCCCWENMEVMDENI